MPIKLNQLIAVEKGMKARAHAQLSEHFLLLKKADQFSGLDRTYRPLDDEGDKLPSEKKVVRTRANDILAALRISQSALIDITLQKDLANQKAVATIYDAKGVEIAKDIPVTTLLFIEKQLEHYRTFLEELPVLDNADVWQFDEQSGLYRTEPVETHRNKKVMKVLTLALPTDRHPAQAQAYQEDVLAGYWATVKQSGAVPYTWKLQRLEKVEEALIGVKKAREAANDLFAVERTGVGAAILDFLLGTAA